MKRSLGYVEPPFGCAGGGANFGVATATSAAAAAVAPPSSSFFLPHQYHQQQQPPSSFDFVSAGATSTPTPKRVRYGEGRRHAGAGDDDIRPLHFSAGGTMVTDTASSSCKRNQQQQQQFQQQQSAMYSENIIKTTSPQQPVAMATSPSIVPIARGAGGVGVGAVSSSGSRRRKAFPVEGDTQAPWWKQQKRNKTTSGGLCRSKASSVDSTSGSSSSSVTMKLCFVCHKELGGGCHGGDEVATALFTADAPKTTDNRNTLLNYWNFRQRQPPRQQQQQPLQRTSTPMMVSSTSSVASCAYCDRYVCRSGEGGCSTGGRSCSQTCFSCDQVFCLFCVSTDYGREGDARVLCVDCQREEQRDYQHKYCDGMHLG